MTRSPLRRLFFALLRRLVLLWVRSETMPSPALSSLDRDRPLLYVLQRPSLSDLAVLDRECEKAGLPCPLAPLTLGAQRLPVSSFVLLPDAGWCGRRRARLSHASLLERLVEALPEEAGPGVQIVPVSVFWGQSPDRETSPWKLLFADSWAVTGRLRKLFTLMALGRRTRVQFARPIPLDGQQVRELGRERTLRRVHRLARVVFRHQKTAVIGPDLSHRRTLVKGLLHAAPVRQAIRDEAEREGISPGRAEARALRYGNEIASNYTYTALRALERLLAWFWHRIYDGIRVNHIDRLQALAPGHEVVYVPCHRSHIDYLLLSYLLFHHGLTPPHVAAGINLDIPVVGSLLRRGGAFFIRRTFKGNALYTAVFHEYLHTLFRRGFPVEYFIEGGRSRTGRALQPKTGMLALTLRSYLRDARLPILFVPVYVGYERVLEGRTYLGELRGSAKKQESLFDLFKVFGALRQEFGQVWVNFGEPLKLDDFLDQEQPGWRRQALGPEYRPAWLTDTTLRLAQRIAERQNEAVSVNPVNLVALALLSSNRQALDERSLARLLDLFLSLLRAVPYSASTTLPEGDGQALIEHVRRMGMLTEQQDALGRIVRLDEQNAVLMTYYRNNILHLFALPGLLASFFHSGARMSREQLLRFTTALYPYLRAELFLRHARDELQQVTDQWLAAFVEQGLLRRDGDVFIRPAPSSRPFVRLTLVARAMQPTLQRFYMTTSLLLNAGQYHLSAEELETLSTQMARRLSILHGLNAPEFFDKSLFRHFIQTLQAEGVLQADEDGRLGYAPRLADVSESVAKRVLSADIRLSIRQVALDRDDETPVQAS